MRLKTYRFIRSIQIVGDAVAILAILLGFSWAGESAKPFIQKDVFIGGENGYHTYRIPAIVTTDRGTLLAFCEGRKYSGNDSGDIDLLLRRSTDGGTTWSRQQVVWDDRDNTCGNPCVIIDCETGVVWLLMTWNRGDDSETKIIQRTSKDTRRVFACHSSDDGATWSRPVEITTDVKKGDWTWYATGPGNGIQLTHGDHKGRLVAPCDHREAKTDRYCSHVLYSDDHGRTWQLGGTAPQLGTNECAVVELTDGRLLLNMRNHGDRKNTRAVCSSPDGGMTWDHPGYDDMLIEPVCQASMLGYRSKTGNREGWILFSNPAAMQREKMTVRLSHDDGRTWPAARLLYKGPSAYSSLTALPDGRIGCLFECGANNPYEKITFTVIPTDWLSRDKMSLLMEKNLDE
jgi:sialidase-1